MQGPAAVPIMRTKVHDCIKLTPATVRSLSWLPPTCAYRLVAEGRDLAWWHPLVSGSAASEKEVRLADYPDHIGDWPGKVPRTAKTKTGKTAS